MPGLIRSCNTVSPCVNMVVHLRKNIGVVEFVTGVFCHCIQILMLLEQMHACDRCSSVPQAGNRM